MLSKNYIDSMKLGFIYQEYLQDHYENEMELDMDELGEAVKVAVSKSESPFDALKSFTRCLDEMMDGKEYHTEEFYNDYSRGFIAGEIIGYPSKETLELAERAEEVWKTDQTIGYYQDVLNDIQDKRICMETELKNTILSLLCYAQDNHMYEHDRNSLLRDMVDNDWIDQDVLEYVDKEIYQNFIENQNEVDMDQDIS